MTDNVNKTGHESIHLNDNMQYAQQGQYGQPQGQQYGTISQLISGGGRQQSQEGGSYQMRGGSVSSVNMGEAVAGSQRVVQTGQHWWVQHPEDEPLPGCNIPVCISPCMPRVYQIAASGRSVLLLACLHCLPSPEF